MAKTHEKCSTTTLSCCCFQIIVFLCPIFKIFCIFRTLDKKETFLEDLVIKTLYHKIHCLVKRESWCELLCFITQLVQKASTHHRTEHKVRCNEFIHKGQCKKKKKVLCKRGKRRESGQNKQPFT